MKKIALLMICIPAFTIIFASEGFKLPPDEILKVFDAPDDQLMSVVSGTDKAIEYTYERYETLEDLSRDKLSLAGNIIFPGLHSEKTRFAKKYLKTVDLNTLERTEITPADEKAVLDFEISPDRKYIAYLSQLKDGVYLRVADIETGRMVFKDTAKVNMSMSELLIKWSTDSRSLFIPRPFYGSDPVPEKTVADIAPVAEESSGRTAQLRTYSNLLQSAFDIRLFEYFFTSQFVKLDVQTGTETPVGDPGIYRSFSQSPDGKYFLVRKISEPYSFTVPYYRFGYSWLILDFEGKEIKNLVTKEVQDEIPIGGVEIGIRDPRWIPQESSVLCWTEANDGGDPKKKVPFRDSFYKLNSPFSKKSSLFLKTKNRGYISGFTQDKGRFVYLDYDRDNEWMSTYFGSYDGSADDKLLFTRSENEKYEHPGDFVTTRLPNGYEAIRFKNGLFYLYGQGYSPEGNFPFLQSFDPATGNKQLLFRCSDKEYENFSGFAGTGTDMIVITKETPEEPRNYFTLDISTGQRKQITSNFDHAPEVREIRTELVTYMREDSLTLSGKLYMPPDCEPGKKYPVVIWAYPREYVELSTAGQVTGSQYTYTRFWGASVKYLALHGYVVLDNASMPVIGDIEKRNDTFISQIVMNAKAALDYLDGRGLIDRTKAAVGGHSYGAFMTANLLAHSDLFTAGIANSGAYNRTLTPFGFQSEERTYWQAKDFYHKASPFTNADSIKTPLLLIHGADDSNAGTYPMQSERMYAAIKGNGGTARLVMLPYEGHGYESREANL
ncbi:MAG TPA: prolyl oligopeptidase family serine peptidase, partial [Clostridiales bacterium]|nr:prolyl oligopeptidase family serine peptidase [Clostridiales bacterium]